MLTSSERDSSECQVENRPHGAMVKVRQPDLRLLLSSRREMTLTSEILLPWPGEGSERLTTFQGGRGQSWDPGVEVTGPSIRTIQEENVLLQRAVPSPLCKMCKQTRGPLAGMS